jgi:chromosome segregation protein
LESALNDSSSLEAAVKKVLSEIDTLFKQAESPKEKKEAPSELTKEFEKITHGLRELENRIMELRDREKSLEKNQEAFYGVFKEVLAEVQSSRNALDEWGREQQSKTLEHERLLMRKEELGRQIEQIGRRPEEFRAVDGEEEIDAHEAERRMFRLRGELAAIGEIDEAILNEARETEARHEFLERESADLFKAQGDLRQMIKDLSQKIRTQFDDALGSINAEFQKFFELMFGGGTAKLKLVKKEPKAKPEPEEGEVVASDLEDEDEAEEGIEVVVSLPRKRINSLDALSGGERSLVGIATVFALISVSPPPFLVLDEIDAPLDERNARRFAEMLKEFSKETQFSIVTHNRATMEAADVLYGVTVGEDGTSKVLSMKFDQASVKN